MSSSASQSTSGDVVFGDKSNESKWLIPGLIIGAIVLGLVWLASKKGK